MPAFKVVMQQTRYCLIPVEAPNVELAVKKVENGLWFDVHDTPVETAWEIHDIEMEGDSDVEV